MKSIKVYLWGKRMKDIYPYANKWEVRKYKLAKFLRDLTKKLFIVTIIAIGSIALFNYLVPNKIVVTNITTDTLTPKIEDLKQEALNNLKSCESAGYKESDGIIIFDSNKKASIGSFQFQKATVIHYYKTLYNKDITGKESVLIALDDFKAEQLAKDIIFTTDNGYKNWLNCSVKHNIKGTVDIINKIK